MPTKSAINRYSSEFKSSTVSLHKTGRSANSLAKEYIVNSEMTQDLAIAPIKTILKRPNHPTIIHSDMGKINTPVPYLKAPRLRLALNILIPVKNVQQTMSHRIVSFLTKV